MKYIPKHLTPWSPLKPKSYLEEIKPVWQTNKSVLKKSVKRKKHTTVKKSSILLDLAIDTTKKKVEDVVMTVGSLPFRLYGTVAKTLADWTMPNEDTYKNAHNKFGESYGHERDNIVNVHNGKSGERIRLEMMGFRNVNGKYKYPNPKYKPFKKQDEMSELKRELGLESKDLRKYLSWCAENGNVISGYYGRPTTGNAWTRHGIYGDSIIVKAPYTKDLYIIPKATLKSRSMLSDQGKYVEDHIDDEGVELQSGDIVDLRYPGSDYTNRAWREGDPNLPNSHTGTIIKTGPKKGNTYVAHYVGGLLIEPIGDLIGTGIKKVYITGIRRPGTKEHPYKKRGGRLITKHQNSNGKIEYQRSLKGVGVDSKGNLLDPDVPSARGTVRLPDVIVSRKDPRKPISSSDDKNTIGLILRDRMYKTVPPTGYYKSRIYDFIEGNTDRIYEDVNTEALYGKYLGLDSIIGNIYKIPGGYEHLPETIPGRKLTKYEAKELGDESMADFDSGYIKAAVKDFVRPSSVEKGAYELIYPGASNIPNENVGKKGHLHNHSLGTYTVIPRKNGVEYVDSWDVNPFKGVSSTDDDFFTYGKYFGLDKYENIVPWGLPYKIRGIYYNN